MKYEYRTTAAIMSVVPPNPIVPDNGWSNWEMCGMAATSDRLIWCWRREVKQVYNEYSEY